jgi:hypothetical protein
VSQLIAKTLFIRRKLTSLPTQLEPASTGDNGTCMQGGKEFEYLFPVPRLYEVKILVDEIPCRESTNRRAICLQACELS